MLGQNFVISTCSRKVFLRSNASYQVVQSMYLLAKKWQKFLENGPCLLIASCIVEREGTYLARIFSFPFIDSFFFWKKKFTVATIFITDFPNYGYYRDYFCMKIVYFFRCILPINLFFTLRKKLKH
jgi:hypothetical protein